MPQSKTTRKNLCSYAAHSEIGAINTNIGKEFLNKTALHNIANNISTLAYKKCSKYILIP